LSRKTPFPLVSILVVDDHGIVRDGIRALLVRQDGFDVVGLAATGEQAVLAAERFRPDVIVMDLALPELSGIDATTRILGSLPLTKVVVLSASSTSEHIYRAFRAGAGGFVSKEAAGSELVFAIRTVLSGKEYLSSSLTTAFAGVCPREPFKKPFKMSPLERLSAREREVLHRTAEGYSSAQIALQLSLSSKTVDTYRSRLMH
jgi:DNA-binding NarL/FixJ family response regulator